LASCGEGELEAVHTCHSLKLSLISHFLKRRTQLTEDRVASGGEDEPSDVIGSGDDEEDGESRKQ